MKLIDKKGKIFGKFNIIDFITIVFTILLLALAGMKVLNKDLSDLAVKDEIVNIKVLGVIEENKDYLGVIKKGDQLGETKHYLDAYVDSVEVLPLEVTNNDSNGNPVVSEDPFLGLARVEFSIEAPLKNLSYRLGKQELRQGKVVFLESDLYRFKLQIESIKVVD